MMQGKSCLNADAAPYIPISKNSSYGDKRPAKKIMGVSEKSEDVGEAAGRQLPDNVSLEQSLEKPHVSDKLSTNAIHSYYSDRKNVHDETSVDEKQSMTDDINIAIDFLMIRFPGYCAESIAELLDFNNGDLEDTIDLLELETEPIVSAKPPGTSEFSYGVGPASQNSDFSRTGSSS